MRPCSTPLAILAFLLLIWPALAQSPGGVPALPPDGTRRPSALAFSPDGRLLYVAEQAEGQVALLDAETGRTLARVPSGGSEPVALAVSPDGKTVAVANSFSGSLGILDVERRVLRATLPLPGSPYGVAITPAGEAFVSLSQLDEIAVVDLGPARELGRIPLGVRPASDERVAGVNPGHRPRSLVLTPDGTTLLCANMSGGSLSLVDVATRKEAACVPLPAVNLRGVAVAADGRTAYVSGQQPNPEFRTARPEETWSNVVCVVRLDGAGGRLDRVLPLDQPGRGAADPSGLAVDPATGRLLVALGGAHEVAVIGPRAPEQREPWRASVGPDPLAVAARPDSAEVWVASHLGGALSVLRPDGGTVTVARTISLEPPSKPDRRLPGRLLFTSAHLVRGGRFTCNTCHPDGNTDGLSWRFAHVPDGIERRNSRGIRGAILLTPPYRWVPRETDFEEFVNDEVAGLFGAPKLPHRDVHALWDLVNEMPLPPNPYRAPDGSHTAAALRGQALFTGKADCVSCHAGPQSGGTGKKAWIGTTPKGIDLDVPHLAGGYDTAPYLHDGRAATLEDLFLRHNPDRLHGKVHVLSPEELADLLRYVREL